MHKANGKKNIVSSNSPERFNLNQKMRESISKEQANVLASNAEGIILRSTNQKTAKASLQIMSDGLHLESGEFNDYATDSKGLPGVS